MQLDGNLVDLEPEVRARTGQVDVELRAERVILEDKLAMFPREHKVNVDLNQGWRHGRTPFVKRLRRMWFIANRYPGCATVQRPLGSGILPLRGIERNHAETDTQRVHGKHNIRCAPGRYIP